MTNDTTTDPLLGFSPTEIVVGPAGQTLAQAATETAVWCDYNREDCPIPDCRRDHRAPPAAAREPFLIGSTADRAPASAHATPRRIHDGGEVRCGDLMGPHEGVRLCGACATTSPDERTIPCEALLEATPAKPASVRIRLLGYDLEHDAFDPSKDVLSTGTDDVATVDDVLDWVSITADRDRRNLEVRGREIWVRGACAALAVIEATPAEELAEEIPASLAKELAAMTPADRAVAERVADLELIEPAPGWEQRAVDRARRDGVLPTP